MPGAEFSEILNLKEMVKYQDGSVVSRTLIGKKSGTITLFAFDTNQELSEHTAPFDAFVSVLEGEAEITISGEHFHLKEGDGIIMPANVPHAVKAAKRFKMMLVMIKEGEKASGVK